MILLTTNASAAINSGPRARTFLKCMPSPGRAGRWRSRAACRRAARRAKRAPLRAVGPSGVLAAGTEVPAGGPAQNANSARAGGEHERCALGRGGRRGKTGLSRCRTLNWWDREALQRRDWGHFAFGGGGRLSTIGAPQWAHRTCCISATAPLNNSKPSPRSWSMTFTAT